MIVTFPSEGTVFVPFVPSPYVPSSHLQLPAFSIITVKQYGQQNHGKHVALQVAALTLHILPLTHTTNFHVAKKVDGTSTFAT